MENIIKEIRHAGRTLTKKPGFTVIAVVALALGIGANSAIFSVVNATLLSALPVSEPDRLVALWEGSPSRGDNNLPVSYLNFLDWTQQNTVFQNLAVFQYTGFNLVTRKDPERVTGARVSADLFPLLRVPPAYGRWFLPEEDKPGASGVVVLSYGLWQRKFGGDPDIVGQSMTLSNETFTVVGIMPQGFRFPFPLHYNGQLISEIAELWIPIGPGMPHNIRGNYSLFSLGRLKGGVSIAEAQAEMTNIEARLEEQYPDTNYDIKVRLVPMHDQVVGSVKPALLVMLGAVAFVLLIACANVANLLLARATSRQKEIAIRTALGATRFHIIRQLLTESLILSLLGGGLGLLLAMWAIDAILALGPGTIPLISETGLDLRVLAFTFLASIATGLIFGLVPALQVSRPDLNESLKDGTKGAAGATGGNRLRNALVVGEVALSLVLLVGAGLMIRSFFILQNTSPGFNAENALTVKLNIPQTKYREDAQVTNFYRAAIQKIETLPGVQFVGAISHMPMTRDNSYSDFRIEGRPDPPPGQENMAGHRWVTPNYFKAMGIAFLQGRDFTEGDNAGADRVAIINESLARRYFPNEDPLGKRISRDDGSSWAAIVGVVADVKHKGLDTPATPEAFYAHSQTPFRNMSIVVRTANDPATLASVIRNEILSIDSDQPISMVATLKQLTAGSISQRRFNMLLLLSFAGVALVLATVGIYGVMSYTISQRTSEIGIRMALGAQRSDILKMVVRQGMGLALGGVAAGVAISFALTWLMSSLLYGVSASDPLTFGGVALLLAAVALAACLIPARKATRVDPMIALRYE